MSSPAERIEATRFLGAEWLTWLWFETELCEGRLELPELGEVEVWLDSLLDLGVPEEKGERSQLRGLAPSGSREARVALECGKVPLKARVHLRVAERDFACVITAATLARSSVVVPAVIKTPEDEAFHERMGLLDELDRLLLALFGRFLRLRALPEWERVLVPALKAWVEGEETLEAPALRKLLVKAGAAPAAGPGKRRRR